MSALHSVGFELIRADTSVLPSLSSGEWRRLLPLLHLHGLEGLVYSRWRDQLPIGVTDALRERWQERWRRNLLYQSELKWLARACMDAGIELTVLKGMAVAEELYADLGARSISDIDLMIDESSGRALAALLVGRGYSLDTKSLSWEANCFKGNWSRFDADGTEIAIDLHHKLFYGEPRGFCWETWGAEPSGVSRLADEPQLVHLMGHLAYQHTFQRINWLVDVDRFVRRKGSRLDWSKVAALCAQLGQLSSARAVLWCAQRYLGTPIEPSWLGSFGRGWSRGLWKSVLSRRFLWAPKEHVFRFYALNNMMKDSWREALRYDLIWLKRHTFLGNTWKQTS